MKDKYIEECKVIQQNCTYTAETHHQMATSAKRQAFWLEVIPAICAALSGVLVSTGILGTKTLIISIISSVITAVSAVLNPNKTYQAHLEAAKNFTALKHDARFMHEAMLSKLSDESFALAVEHLHQKYNEFLKTVPPTNAKSFKKAQAIVQGGVHEPDRDEEGNVK
jgi:hypothetical protein